MQDKIISKQEVQLNHKCWGKICSVFCLDIGTEENTDRMEKRHKIEQVYHFIYIYIYQCD